MKSTFYLLLLIALTSFSVHAQERVITGTVTDQDDKAPLPGVSVRVKGTTVGTQTGANGEYSIRVQSGNNTLTFTYIGYATRDVSLGTGNVLNVSMATDATQLGEVVVTALGISREQKALGYAATTIKADEITAARNANVMSGLQGKVAGVNISNSGQVGGSSKVIIRGLSSFSSNNPLYVVDGVPVNNETRSNAFTGGNELAADRTVDFGNQGNDINPEDVESVTVLKGASATALYGSRAAHGVIMITTKRGSFNQKLSITYTGSANFSNVLRVPQTQNVFGQGWPYEAREENGSWGPRLDGIVRPWGTELDGVSLEKPFAYIEDNVRNFYDTGVDVQNSISLSGGGQNNSYMFSYSNASQNGPIPTQSDKYNRNTFSFRGNAKYDRFETNYNVTYARSDARAVATGQGTAAGGGTVFQELIQIPTDINITSLKDYHNIYNNPDNYFTAYAENPYFLLNENANKLQDDRVFGKLELSYEVAKGLRAVGRVGGDFNNARLTDHSAIVTFSPGSFSEVWEKQPTVGRFGENTRRDQQVDANVFLQGDYKLNEDFSLGGIAGFNYNQRRYTYLDSYVTNLNVPNWYSLQNTSGAPVTETRFNERRLIGAYGNIDMGFRNYWYVNLSLRNDWSSTLPSDSRSFFYWGMNSSLVLSDMFKELQAGKLNFLKVRAAWGQTGNDAAPYRVNTSFLPAEIPLPTSGANIFLPVGGVAGLTQSNNQGNPNLEPEITTEWELGLDTRWFDNRVGLDVAYYNRETEGQIIRASVPAESGFTTRTLNIGNIANKGIEARLSLVPVRSSDFEWEFATNFTKNNSEVLKLFGDASEFLIQNLYEVDYVAEIGKPLGIFKVPAFQTVQSGPHAGKIVVGANGLPLTDPNRTEEVGTSNPDFTLGFINSLKYKNFTLNAVVDWRSGGKFYSYTKQLNNFVGNSTETTFNYRQPFLVPNSVKISGTDAEGNPVYVENNNQISWGSIYAYWNSTTNPNKFRDFVLDRDFVKLREVTLTYSLPKKFVSRAKLSAIDVSLIGRNLLLFTPDNNNFVDPENSTFGNDILSEVGEFATGPSMRSFGASVRVTF